MIAFDITEIFTVHVLLEIVSYNFHESAEVRLRKLLKKKIYWSTSMSVTTYIFFVKVPQSSPTSC